MRELFDRLLAEGEAGVDRLVAERTQESVTLDFKKKVDASNGRPDDQDKRVLAKAMSAFANSAGGLIVYGVHGVPGSDGVDCAQATRPIAEIERFVSALHELSGELLQPRHSGIQVGLIRSERTPGSGYAVVNVERSERRPHRSEAKDQKQYFKRGGSKSYAMEHFDIEDAFRRYDVAKLSLEWALDRTHTDGNDDLFFQVTFWLRNTSRVTAHRPYIKIRNAKGFDPRSAKASDFAAVADREWTCFECIHDIVIHPDRTLIALRVREDIRRYPGGQVTVRKYPRGPFLRFDYGIGCENSAVEEGSMLLSVEDLHEQAEAEYQAMLVERAPRSR